LEYLGTKTEKNKKKTAKILLNILQMKTFCLFS